MKLKTIALALLLSAMSCPDVGAAPAKASPQVLNCAPVQYFLRFVSTARSANSIEAILPYLTSLEQDKIKRTQTTYDPKVAAENRAMFKAQNPNMSEDALDHITGSPQNNRLKQYKKIANKFYRVMDAYMKKPDVCIIKIATDNRGNPRVSQSAPFGTAECAMVQEGNVWKFHEYVDRDGQYATPQ